MADKAVVFGAVDLFGLGSDFKVQSSSVALARESDELFDKDGHGVNKQSFNPATRYKASYGYNGSNLGAGLVALIGGILNEILVDKISIKFSIKKQVVIDIEGHQHPDNPHEESETEGDFLGYAMGLATLIGTSQGVWGIPGTVPWSNSETAADLISLTLDFSAEHQDNEGAAGTHWAGRSHSGKVEVSAEYIGEPTLTTTGWVMTAEDQNQANKDNEKSSYKGFKHLTAELVPAP